MRNLLETIAVWAVVLLALGIVALIIMYNRIEDNTFDDTIIASQIQKTKVTSEDKTNNYLKNLEGYGDDVNVKADANKEDKSNQVVIKSEVQKGTLDDIVQDTNENSYVGKLEAYGNDKQEKEVKKDLTDAENVIKLDKEEVPDEIGDAIDDIVN